MVAAVYGRLLVVLFGECDATKLRPWLGSVPYQERAVSHGEIGVRMERMGSSARYRRVLKCSCLVPSFGITVTYFTGVQAAVARALARRRIISFAKSSRVKVHWNGAADFS